MKHLVEKLNILQAETSSNMKIMYLQDFLQNEDFRIFVEMALDETLHYNIAKLTQGGPKKPEPDFYLLVDYLYYLASKQGANAEEKKELASFAIDPNWETIITRIIKKDLKCGVGAKLINKAVPGTLQLMPYMRCCTSKKIDCINYPAYAQVKEDGLFCNIFWNNTNVKYLSRSGNEFLFPEPSLENEIREYYPEVPEPMVYMGELRVKIDGKWLPRKTSNGIITKALKKNQSISTGESLKVHFICWDVVPGRDFWKGECAIEYKERFDQLYFFDDMKKHHLSQTRVVDSTEEAQEWALKLIESGEEGVIIKNFDALWKFHTSTSQIKLKAGDIGIDNERECELRVVDWYYGKKGTKYEDCLGGLVCISEDDLLEVNIGGGFSDEDRGFLGWTEAHEPIVEENIEDWIIEKYDDRIITVRFNEVIKAKTSKKHSLFSPRFIETRNKKVADTLQYIKELL